MLVILQPLLIVSDGVSANSGLARIARDLAVRVNKFMDDEFRIATAGYGAPGSRKYPWTEYHFQSIQNWVLPELPTIAADFAGDEDLIVMFIWDLSRMYWFADPDKCPMPHLRQWLKTAKIKKWLYHPVDAEGPGGGLSQHLAQTLTRFDRVLDYSAFSSAVTGNPDHLPHGIDTSIFRPYDRLESRAAFRRAGFENLTDNSCLVGIVATNQNRKDWALGIETCRMLLDRGHDVKVWCHTDVLDRFWSLPNLFTDFGMQGRVVVLNNSFNDHQLARFYAACDVTLGIGLGEGFGYPIYESLACGIPCVHGDYGGGAEYLPPSMKVKPLGYRYEGQFNCKRPVFSAVEFADVAEENLGLTAALPEGLDWNGRTLWPAWRKWFMDGAQ
jgi:glycosyltransferase involved in cell wall biosynthesis